MIEEEQLDGSEQVKFHYYGVLKSVASRFKNDAISQNAMKKPVYGRGKATAPQKYRQISLVTKRNRNVIPSQIVADHTIATGTHVFVRIILGRLNQVGLHAEKLG